MTISKKHFIEISNIIRNNYEFTKEYTNNKWEFNHTINTKVISDLSEYFTSINNRFDNYKFITNSVPNKDRHEDSIKAINKIDHKKIDDEIKLLKAENQFNKDCADQYKKQARVLQSKVKTYEQDIVEANRKKLRSRLRSSNDLDKSKSLW